jgi:hypothetical protein
MGSVFLIFERTMDKDKGQGQQALHQNIFKISMYVFQNAAYTYPQYQCKEKIP